MHGRVRQTSNTAKIIRPGQGGKSSALRKPAFALQKKENFVNG
ncbi:hypothetical protein HMPREF1548_03103 [Clostridium sp. KLE 1755]|nr:hypothetical protein HMPREF1548_03103 [Clostridium sp. KLE 1755]